MARTQRIQITHINFVLKTHHILFMCFIFVSSLFDEALNTDMETFDQNPAITIAALAQKSRLRFQRLRLTISAPTRES